VSHADGPRATALLIPEGNGVSRSDVERAIAEVTTVPFDVRFVTELPRTLEGKLDGPRLKDPSFAAEHTWGPSAAD
jgi:hypothetical protein